MSRADKLRRDKKIKENFLKKGFRGPKKDRRKVRYDDQENGSYRKAA